MKRLLLFSAIAFSSLFITTGSILAEPKETKPVPVQHDWEQIHLHTEDRLVDKYKKKINTLVSHHYHDVHVYRTIHVYTYRCSIHGEYKSIVDMSNKRIEEQPH
jgi:hypothetical protein